MAVELRKICVRVKGTKWKETKQTEENRKQGETAKTQSRSADIVNNNDGKLIWPCFHRRSGLQF